MNVNDDDPERGIAWARGGLIFGVCASIAGNVANAALTVSPIHVSLRVPGAIFWPLAFFVGIEVMVRNRHRFGSLARLGFILLLGASIPTFITSFLNLKGFMEKAGEHPAATITGPLAIDGLMLGCTIMLLAATVRSLPVSLAPAAREMTDEELEEIVEKWTGTPTLSEIREIETMWSNALNSSPAPVSPAPTRTSIDQLSRSMAGVDQLSRGMAGVELLLAGKSPAKVARETGAGESTVYKWRKVLHTLQQDPSAPITEKISADLIEYMRESVREEANA